MDSPSQLFPKCHREGCLEFALSFSSGCWEHTNHEEYLSKIHQNIRGLADKPAFLLNMKKAHVSGLDFSRLDIHGSSFSQARITNCAFIGTNLSDSDMIGAHLDSCDFIGSDIHCGNFTKAVFSSSSFSHSDLRGSYFVEAHFKDTDMMNAVLFDCVLWGAELSGARNIKKNNFKNPDSKKLPPDCHLSETNILGAHESYRSVKHYFYSNGLYDAGSWAAYRQLTMERKHFFQKRDPRYIPSFLMDLLSGYTEKPHRVIISSILIIAFFGVLYYLFSVPVYFLQNGGSGKAGFWDSLYFSFITFTTVGYGDFTPKPVIWFRLLACAEAFSGPFMAGLYIFTLTRRYAAN